MRDFIRDYLGPQLKTDHPQVQIMLYDHNKDNIVNWVKTVFSDPVAAKYADGTAFHWYSGSEFENLADANAAAPNKFLLGMNNCLQLNEIVSLFRGFGFSSSFSSSSLATEACTCPPAPGDWTKGEKYAFDILGDLNNYAVGWTDWNMLLDLQGGPNHLNNFCDAPIMAAIQQQTIRFENPYY